MKLFAFSKGDFLLGACYFVCGVYGACSADNCYRAMFPSTDLARLASAQSFCQSYTQAVMTATTGFSPLSTSACGSAPSAYSSACLCGLKATAMTTTTLSKPTLAAALSCAPTPYKTWQNGGFECGIYPWRALVTHGAKYAVTSPGKSGSFAFEVDWNGHSDGVRLGQGRLSQFIDLTTGTHYVLTFDTHFNNGLGGFITVYINGQNIATVDGRAGSGPGSWISRYMTFQAQTTTIPSEYLIEFEFAFVLANSVAKIDNIRLTPGT
ncbi:hypothetical protein LTR66_009453 [Elasticomyces elasticus]|nr:hypothetical protein LTR66_009453 [Elasticomyces elasticus]